MDMSPAASPALSAAPAPAFAEVLFFGRVSDTFGRSAQVSIPREGCRLSDVMASLCELFDTGATALTERGLRTAVAREIVIGDVWVRPGQEVAFFSPFSGG
ncbi:MoaD/ThiS family protein [Phenylobacterium sp.]|uniref:MoaD/ThiS family protein n=1 Tax=Phenylobacterium sp. TaxID=1871053 RepID=UPI002BFA9B44|nr:MoaD/ThiS family protein [Phenylobacterium sp.]HVI33494.1 MoaD/ThiS family protein [Phenylobacterium sp.]